MKILAKLCLQLFQQLAGEVLGLRFCHSQDGEITRLKWFKSLEGPFELLNYFCAWEGLALFEEGSCGLLTV